MVLGVKCAVVHHRWLHRSLWRAGRTHPSRVVQFFSSKTARCGRLFRPCLIIERAQALQTWLEAESASGPGADRAEEFAQAGGYSPEAGAMAVKLCQEYAETLK